MGLSMSIEVETYRIGRGFQHLSIGHPPLWTVRIGILRYPVV